MNIDQTRALRKLTALHGRAVVSKLLPVVANRGFGAICEISVNHPWSVKDGYIQIPHADAEWVPMFENSELWETAAGYVAPSAGPAISIMHSQYSGKVTPGSGAQAGLFIARLLEARGHGQVYISPDGTRTTREEMFWDSNKE